MSAAALDASMEVRQINPQEEPMTKELLEQYPDICGEIRELEEPVTDVVKGSMPDYPFTERSVTIKGLGSTQDLAALKAAKTAIRDFVDGLPDAKQRRIVRMRVFKQMTWGQVAAKMGHRYSEDGVRKVYTRIIDKYF